MILLPVSHHPQQYQSDCLAACTAMVLAYFRVTTSYSSLIRILAIDEIGAPFRNLRNLQPLGLEVNVHTVDMAALSAHLENGLPVIAAVDTAELGYWHEATDHAIVVVGIDGEFVYVNDPELRSGPKRVARDEFEPAWWEKDYHCGILLLS